MTTIGVIGNSKIAVDISRKNRINSYTGNSKFDNMNSAREVVEMTQTPRTIVSMMPSGVMFDSFLKSMSKDDTLIDCSYEHWTNSVIKNDMCEKNGVNYLGAGLSGNAIMLGGSQDAWNNSKTFLETLCGEAVYMGVEPDMGHFTNMIHGGMESAMIQVIADIYSYCNQDYLIVSRILEDISGPLAKKIQCDIKKNYSDVCEPTVADVWCVNWATEQQVPLIAMNTALQYKNLSTLFKGLNHYKKLTTLPHKEKAKSVIEFVYALVFLEGISLLESKGIHGDKMWSEHNMIWCDMCKMTENDLRSVMDRNIYDVRYIVDDCCFKGISIPVISAALQYYEFTHTTVTQMSLVNQLKSSNY